MVADAAPYTDEEEKRVRRRRASEVRVDRILRLDPAGVRRQGAVLDEGRFSQVAAAVRAAR